MSRNKTPRSVEERLEALEANNDRLERENAELRSAVAKASVRFPAGTEIEPITQFIDDPTRVIGLRAGLYCYNAISTDHWKMTGYGYRKAEPSDFVDELSHPETGEPLDRAQLFEMATKGGIRGAGHVLYVCTQENKDKRARRELARSAAASREAMAPEFRDPQLGNVAVERDNHGKERRL